MSEERQVTWASCGQVEPRGERTVADCIKVVEGLNPKLYTSAKRYQEAVLDRLRELAAPPLPGEDGGQ